jgi:hypothetical protein
MYYISVKEPGNVKSAYLIVTIITGLIISAIIAAGLGVYLPEIKANSIYYTVSVLTAILIIPIAIVIIHIRSPRESGSYCF